MAGFLDKERIVAPKNFNRWLIPPAALASATPGGVWEWALAHWQPERLHSLTRVPAV